MPTKRTRTTRNRHTDFSNTLIYTATDAFWGDPSQLDSKEHFLDERYRGRRHEVWGAIRNEFLPEWIDRRPGTRPSWWYDLDPDCPRISAEDIARCNWEGCFFIKDLPDLRRRLGGTGDPAYEHQSLVPRLRCGVPVDFVTATLRDYYKNEGEDFAGVPIDPNDPPIYESQAAYLRRHNLLTPAEKRLLRKRDFEPEIVTPCEEEEERETADA